MTPFPVYPWLQEQLVSIIRAIIQGNTFMSTVLPGSWIYPLSVDFWSRKLSVDGSRPNVVFCGFFCLLPKNFFLNDVPLSVMLNASNSNQSICESSSSISKGKSGNMNLQPHNNQVLWIF